MPRGRDISKDFRESVANAHQSGKICKTIVIQLWEHVYVFSKAYSFISSFIF